MTLNMFGEPCMTLKELVDLCGYGVGVRVNSSYSNRKFIECATRPYVNRNSIKKSGVDKKFEDTSYVKYGNMPVVNIEPFADLRTSKYTQHYYSLNLYICAHVYDTDIEKARNGEYALTDEQKKEFYDAK